MLQEFFGDRLSVDAGGGVVVPFVAQHTHDLRGERLVQQTEHCASVRSVALGDRPFLDVTACAATKLLDVREERFLHERAHLLSDSYEVSAIAILFTKCQKHANEDRISC